MNNRPTPETDDIARGNHVVPTEWAKQLERERDEARDAFVIATDQMVQAQCKLSESNTERDEAREENAKIRDIAKRAIPQLIELADGTKCVRLEDFLRERDEERTELEMWRDGNILHEIHRNELEKVEHERDEAREELHDIRLNLGEDADGYTLLHAVCVMQNERDDARAALAKILKNE